ncbi:MAG: FkbM family methyltransferase [Acidimicrobiia bacterium]
MREILINGKWPLNLLEHRAERPEWPYWEAATLALAHSLISEGTVVWDVGSEEGDFPALFGTWGAEVVLIEPNPHVWPQIRLHWEANNDRNPLACVVGLASDHIDPATPDYRAGIAEKRRGGIWPHVAFGEVMPAHGFRHIWEHAKVSPQFRLDQLAPWGTPDLITMDIEGGELIALRGCEDVLIGFHPDVMVSVHPAFMADLYGQTPAELLEFMDSVGYKGKLYATDHEEHWWFQ